MSEAPHVAVTGAAGYIGSRVVADIREIHPDWDVTAIDNFYLGDIREIGDVPVEHVDIRNRGWRRHSREPMWCSIWRPSPVSTTARTALTSHTR